MRIIGYLLLVGSAVAFAFLGYSIVSLEQLGIGITHPRILVEAGLGVLSLAAGLIVLR